MLLEQPQLLTLMQALPDAARPEDAPPTLLEYLLAIGVYSDCDSPVGPLAFRLVLRIAHGYEGFRTSSSLDLSRDEAHQYADVMLDVLPEQQDEFPESRPCARFARAFYQRLVAAYAEDFRFAYPVTNQMAAAFAIFWDHEYADLTPGTVFHNSELDKIRYTDPVMPILNPDESESGDTYPPAPRPRRPFTPLDVFVHMLFFDPPHRDDLNLLILRVLHWYHEACFSIRHEDYDHDDRAAYAEYQKKLYDCDLPFYNFVTTKFAVGGELLDMTNLTRALPMNWRDARWNRNRGTVRAPVNGAVFVFGYFWVQSEFFYDDSGRLILGQAPGATLDDSVGAAINAYRHVADGPVIFADGLPAWARSTPVRHAMRDCAEPPPVEPAVLWTSQRSTRPAPSSA
jgi:hypothetical protein